MPIENPTAAHQSPDLCSIWGAELQTKSPQVLWWFRAVQGRCVQDSKATTKRTLDLSDQSQNKINDMWPGLPSLWWMVRWRGHCFGWLENEPEGHCSSRTVSSMKLVSCLRKFPQPAGMMCWWEWGWRTCDTSTWCQTSRLFRRS